jgi:hypothetical protein
MLHSSVSCGFSTFYMVLWCNAKLKLLYRVNINPLANTQLPVVATTRADYNRLRDQLLDQACGDSRDAEKRLDVLRVEVTGMVHLHGHVGNGLDETTIQVMASRVREIHPDLRSALTLSGILHVETSPTQVDSDAALESFRVNAKGHCCS